ncbi:hypothetical protein DSO57_1030712 [Entomophthora muscae]|uniref:Uncharacterized protein n=1 Tax=Entomophthora muscae TaxID=34485 RepID=A0ACC2TZH4_9FUNG|nr:hypothetical protein DSO57_1030712 [Entomophthora muscae]
MRLIVGLCLVMVVVALDTSTVKDTSATPITSEKLETSSTSASSSSYTLPTPSDSTTSTDNEQPTSSEITSTQSTQPTPSLEVPTSTQQPIQTTSSTIQPEPNMSSSEEVTSTIFQTSVIDGKPQTFTSLLTTLVQKKSLGVPVDQDSSSAPKSTISYLWGFLLVSTLII